MSGDSSNHLRKEKGHSRRRRFLTYFLLLIIVIILLWDACSGRGRGYTGGISLYYTNSQALDVRRGDSLVLADSLDHLVET